MFYGGLLLSPSLFISLSLVLSLSRNALYFGGFTHSYKRVASRDCERLRTDNEGVILLEH